MRFHCEQEGVDRPPATPRPCQRWQGSGGHEGRKLQLRHKMDSTNMHLAPCLNEKYLVMPS